ncbi:MAG TPA: efflux RND transporter permease subunit, partial [Candidatus Eisenbacteria bacterium]|nr:efflux RND transporter permease subunit [Candidatus Eisenbacteria bacterium]
LLCYTFIKKGLHAGAPDAGAAAGVAAPAAAPPAAPPKRRFNLLDAMQSAYDRTINLAMARRGLTMILAAAAFLVGVGLFNFLPNRFFPPAERNQFVVDVWLPEGSRLEATDQVVRRLEERVRASKDVVHVASFVGAGAPRFYYNFDPEPSTTNFGQLIVNTASIHATERLTHALEPALAGLAPEARVIVKELQQGAALKAPIEVRLIGPDLHALNRIAANVTAILDSIPGSANVSTDTRENQFGIRVEVDDNVANRVGLSNEGISDALAGSFVGAPVSTFWEGSRAVDIVLRLEESRRLSFDNIPTTYLSSNLTSARVPLREVASLSPEWQPSRIVRRNGLRTITVRSFAEKGTFASAVLEAARPRIAALPLPEGYRVEYGGEWENQNETFGEMLGALGISVLAIFLILLLQFRNVREPLIVMVSIPLSLFGAVLGLLMTGNPFGMTSFLGMISLTGIVVRNGIILVDFILEQRRKGRSVEEAALEAGKRRLRPIFLTTMAAAVGVTPMILSGSAMWSPLASVLAVGLICSMAFTLIVVPVLYVLWRPSEKPAVEAA